MLYLMRKIGESVIINGDVEVKLIEVKGKSAKIGFEFPSTVSVLRKEVHDRVVAENLAASLASSPDGDDLEVLSGIDDKKFRREGDVRPDGSVVEGRDNTLKKSKHPSRRKGDSG